MKKNFLYYYLKELILGSFLLYSGCSSLIRKDRLSNLIGATNVYSPNSKNPSDSFEVISQELVEESKRKLKLLLLEHGIHEQVFNRMSDCDRNFILSEIYIKSPNVNRIVNALKLATVTQILYDYANGLDQFNGAFKRGSFSIEDKENKLFNLLKKSSESLGGTFMTGILRMADQAIIKTPQISMGWI